jgi:uncharacterized protein YozE (UPF0346 family)
MKSLEEGHVAPQAFVGWQKSGCLPCFLKGFTGLVFSGDGGLKDVSDSQVLAIRAIRQLCSAYKKPKQMCSQAKVVSAIEAYIAIDDDMRTSLPDTEDLNQYLEVAAYVVSTVFKDFNPYELVPKHGPGATADRVNGNQKYSQDKITWFERFNRYFCAGEFLYNTEESEHFDTKGYKLASEEQEIPARLSTVPKTMQKPRVIALEPTSMQMIQQPIKDYLVNSIERCPLTRGHVNFSRQDVNQRLALINSRTRQYGTVDLSAASDRVSAEQIYLLFSVYPLLRDVIFTARSKRVDISGKIRTLNKFASMGSALCFPCEALYFYVLCICSILKSRNLPVSSSNISSVAKEVYVYGDDIIIPSDEVENLSRHMSLFKAQVGLEKTFYKGFFRESCGKDAYAGVDITPVYIRHIFPSSSKDYVRIVSYVESCNQFHYNGYVKTAAFIQSEVEALVGSLPTVGSTCPGIGWHFGDSLGKRRFSKTLQRVEVSTFVVDIRPNKDVISGYAALQKFFLTQGKKTLDTSYPVSFRRAVAFAKSALDKRHLLRSYGFGALTLKRRWVQPY